MVPFGNWALPVHFGSQLAEHHAVRQAVGMFDVCHMRAVDITGPEARAFLRYLLANDVQKLRTSGKALYSCLLQHDGTILDDLIAYFIREDWFRLVVNANTTAKDIQWLQEAAPGYTVTVVPRFDLGMLAVQGPHAATKLLPCLPDAIQNPVFALPPFHALEQADWFISRTGYTGEDGFEIILPNDQLERFWQQLAAADIQPCGLGARDTLRLEAGMNLYGQDMNEQVTPWTSGLSWTVDLRDTQRHFIGRTALEQAQANDNSPRFIGVVLVGKGILRSQQTLYADGKPVGCITSGGFAPTLQRSIGLARVNVDDDVPLTVGIRRKQLPVQPVKPPFVRQGQILVTV